MRPWGATIRPPRLDARTLGLLCDTTTTLNVWYLQEHPETPLIYLSGVRYGSDYVALHGGAENWDTIPWVLQDARRGIGVDCKRLAAWRCAELRVRCDMGARCVWTSAWDGRRVLYHVFVELEDGTQEDPSAILGMPTTPAHVAGRTGRAYAWSR
jgi:hypothetical protein